MNLRLTVSIVIHDSAATITATLDCLRAAALAAEEYRVLVVDNASGDGGAELVADRYPWVTLLRSANVGFAAGHNLAIRRAWGEAPYHLVLNPDVTFAPGVLPALLEYMDTRPEIGLLMPQVRSPEGRRQYLCKRLPTPFDLLGRRFLPGPLRPLFRRGLERYEMRDRDYGAVLEAPHLSGCFMLLRTSVLAEVGLFDERFFLYMEDIDLSRRIHERHRTVYYPLQHVQHLHRRDSYHRARQLGQHLVSAWRYFRKWGWFFDRRRRAINRRV